MNITPYLYTRYAGVALLILGLLGVAGAGTSGLGPMTVSFEHVVMLLISAFISLAASRSPMSVARAVSATLGIVFASTGAVALFTGVSLIPGITLDTIGSTLHLIVGITGLIAWRSGAQPARSAS